MTTNYHTPHSLNAPLTSAGLNAPLGTLDAAVAGVKVSTGVFDVRDYGAIGTADDTATIQAAIDAASVKGGVVLLTGDVFLVNGIVLKTRVTLRGRRSTSLKATAGGNAAAVILLDVGPVQNARIEDLGISPNGNAGQMGIYFKAVGQATTPFHGGWWNGGLHRLWIGAFSGPSIWLRGGDAANLRPHQFLQIEDVQSFGSATGPALLISGQVGQVNVIGGSFDGPGKTSGTTNVRNVFIERELADDMTTVLSDRMPYSINFIGTTFQSNKMGVVVSRAFPVRFDGCYFENLGQSVTAQNSTGMVAVHGCKFSNAGQVADGSGYIVQVGSGSYAVITENKVDGTLDAGFIKVAGSLPAGITQRDNLGGGTLSTGSQLQVSVAANTITSGTETLVSVNSSAAAITSIANNLTLGSTMVITAIGGSIVFATGGNVSLGVKASPWTQASGTFSTWLRIDASWLLVGTLA